MDIYFCLIQTLLILCSKFERRYLSSSTNLNSLMQDPNFLNLATENNKRWLKEIYDRLRINKDWIFRQAHRLGKQVKCM